MDWYEEYIGLPWARVPRPPRSFSCGELVRHIHNVRLGIDMPDILADPGNLRQCIRDLCNPERYGLRPLASGEEGREYDVVYCLRADRQDHVGIAVSTGEGLRVLHCQQGSGVTLDNPAELLGTGARRLEWYRHHSRRDGPCLLSN